MTFHPDLRLIAHFVPRGLGTPLAVKVMRRLPIPSIPLPSGVSVAERDIGRASPARVRVLRSDARSGPTPVLLWIHGGGFMMGRAKQDDLGCARFVKRLGLTVVSVDYRLAPEHPFPAPLDDCFAAYELVHREAASLGVDPSRLVIGGMSAGGGLAAGLTLRIHDQKLPPPLLQLLVYPMLDDRTTARVVDGRHHRLWNQESNKNGWRAYLGAAHTRDVPDHAAPARRELLSGLPPAWIGVGTHDLFHDEDIEYARRLRDAGVSVELEVVEGGFHGFDVIAAGKPVGRRFFESQAAAIERALSRAP